MSGCFNNEVITNNMINYKIKSGVLNGWYVCSFTIDDVRINVVRKNRLMAILMAIQYYAENK